MSEKRDGEAALGFDPAELPGDGHVVFIGSVSSPWKSRNTCPKNLSDARATGKAASVTIDPPYRPGLAGLERFSHIVLLSWFDRSRRDLITQNPHHAEAPRGTFALRSPVRPNPVGLHVVRLVSLDVETGVIEIDAIDLLDGTPIIDVKPYFASIDSIPDATKA
ncbi:MAG: tRNA (N6-threonylcarbamoyladenosine(37)-N6)-methyltransferase TrmO [Rhizobiaceae bacterium]|nr:tRNA (N6-threonylcarbamoyladenosine(37)-N6)-methyltransferase TrmO [Rhizobiaceae bacterium]